MAKGFDIFSLFMNDWWGSTARKMLSPAGRAAYWELLMTQYSMGSIGRSIIPSIIAASDETLAKNIGFTVDEWRGVKEEVLVYFDKTEDGGLSNPKVAKEIAYKLSRVHGGKARAAQGQHNDQHNDQHKRSIKASPLTSSSSREPPLPPTDVGEQDSPVGVQEPGAKNPRAHGTNPRTVAAHEEKKARAAEVEHRFELIRKLEASGDQGGTYALGKGFKLWNSITTAELEELTK